MCIELHSIIAVTIASETHLWMCIELHSIIAVTIASETHLWMCIELHFIIHFSMTQQQVMKSGDARVVMIGFPSVGKSMYRETCMYSTFHPSCFSLASFLLFSTRHSAQHVDKHTKRSCRVRIHNGIVPRHSYVSYTQFSLLASRERSSTMVLLFNFSIYRVLLKVQHKAKAEDGKLLLSPRLPIWC
jgi:hypothetical protein